MWRCSDSRSSSRRGNHTSSTLIALLEVQVSVCSQRPIQWYLCFLARIGLLKSRHGTSSSAPGRCWYGCYVGAFYGNNSILSILIKCKVPNLHLQCFPSIHSSKWLLSVSDWSVSSGPSRLPSAFPPPVPVLALDQYHTILAAWRGKAPCRLFMFWSNIRRARPTLPYLSTPFPLPVHSTYQPASIYVTVMAVHPTSVG